MVVCSRCGEDRWPTVEVKPYLCQRCREVQRGRSAVVDPVPSAAQSAQRAAHLTPFRKGGKV